MTVLHELRLRTSYKLLSEMQTGNANLSALGDVNFANLTTGQFLQYNTDGNNKWSNTTLNLASIADVDLAGLQDGNALVYSAAAIMAQVVGCQE